MTNDDRRAIALRGVPVPVDPIDDGPPLLPYANRLDPGPIRVPLNINARGTFRWSAVPETPETFRGRPVTLSETVPLGQVFETTTSVVMSRATLAALRRQQYGIVNAVS